MESPEYQAILNQIPEDEKKSLLEAVKKMVDEWENKVIKPLENLKNK